MATATFYHILGFKAGSMSGGFYFGFDSKDSGVLERCYGISVFLVGFYIMIETGFISGSGIETLKIFDTAILFWGLFIGCLAMLIMADGDYLRYQAKLRYDSFPRNKFIMRQGMMALTCLTALFFGTLLYIESMKSIAGTFLVLWLMNLERFILAKLSTGNVTIGLFIVLTNLIGSYKYTRAFPEYFIFYS